LGQGNIFRITQITILYKLNHFAFIAKLTIKRIFFAFNTLLITGSASGFFQVMASRTAFSLWLQV
jgi:hypothetical protein